MTANLVLKMTTTSDKSESGRFESGKVFGDLGMTKNNKGSINDELGNFEKDWVMFL